MVDQETLWRPPWRTHPSLTFTPIIGQIGMTRETDLVDYTEIEKGLTQRLISVKIQIVELNLN